MACKAPPPAQHDAAVVIADASIDADPIRDAPEDGGEDTIITVIRELAHQLAERKIGVSDLAAQLGTRTPARSRQVHVAPTDARLADAIIVRGPDGKLAQVKLELAQPVTLGELRATFGAYEADARGVPLAAWPVAFVRAVRGPAASVSLFADVVRKEPIDAQPTTHVTLQLGAP